MAERARTPLTLDEFLAWDDGTDQRYELIDGEIVAMAPPMAAHGTLAVNIAGELRNRLRAPCRAFAEAGIVRPERTDTFYQADLAISCTPAGPKDRWIRDPLVIIEVLSPSTAAHDRGIKLLGYREVASVREILLIDSERQRAELWQRTPTGWTVTDLVGDATIPLPSLGCELPMSAFYDGVALAS